MRIIAACSQREVTPKEIAEQENLPRGTVGYHFQVLEEDGFLRVSRKERVRGVKRHFYVAIRQRVITDGEFEQIAAQGQREVSAAVLRDLLEVCRDALELGTLDARSDSHLSWSPFELDERGWKEMMSELARVLERSFEIQAGSQLRLRKSGETPIPTIVALAGFEGAPPAPTKSAFTAKAEDEHDLGVGT